MSWFSTLGTTYKVLLRLNHGFFSCYLLTGVLAFSVIYLTMEYETYCFCAVRFCT